MTTIRELYDLHAETDGVPTKAVAGILKELGLKDVKDSQVMDEIDADGTFSKLQYQDLENYYYQKLREEGAAEEIVGALKQHFPSTNPKDTFLSRDQMKQVVEKLGPKLSEDEVTEIMNELDIQGTGRVSAMLFAEYLMKY